ncbi:hypothetical protein HUU53_03010 [Candidatus Micrarchaeota archaeon]|nr:hypothetical protein [Candidatus Micrarchaeota archaeon]
MKNKKGQAAVEYILLIVLGLFIVIVGFTLAFYIRNFADAALLSIGQSRDEVIKLLVK